MMIDGYLLNVFFFSLQKNLTPQTVTSVWFIYYYHYYA